MLYFDEPLVQVFMVQNDEEASIEVECRCWKREERRKNEKGPDTGADFVEKILLFKK